MRRAGLVRLVQPGGGGVNSLFCCPVCGAPLVREESRYRCPRGHSFDLARAGYAHLLPVNRMHSRLPGDDADMVAARADFLGRGYYRPLRDELCRRLGELTAGLPAPAVLDSGCGEGYYTQGLWETLSRGGRAPRLAGIDISKLALRRAAKKVPGGEFAVASVYHLPLPDGSLDGVVDVFAPLSAEEFGRVLRPGGCFLYVVPAARHLWQMKQVLYETPYENREQRIEYPGFAYVDVVPVRDTARLERREDIQALFRMTPYCWRTPRAGREALFALESLDTEIAFDIHIFRRI